MSINRFSLILWAAIIAHFFTIQKPLFAMEEVAYEGGDVVFIEEEYFTRENTQAGIITQKSIANIVTHNAYIPLFNTQDIHSLRTLVENLHLSLFKAISHTEVSALLQGMNTLLKSECTDQFCIFRIDLSTPNAYHDILESLGRITGKYLIYNDRSYGFNIAVFLKNETELWLCEIPPKGSVEQALARAKKGIGDASPFKGKEAEVLQALEMFEPLLKILFIESQPEEVQDQRKACWSCAKGSIVILVMLVVGTYMFLDIFYKCNNGDTSQ